jgi:hypothetical protein
MGTYIENDYRADVTLGRVPRTSKYLKFAEGTITTSPTTVWSGSETQPGVYIYPDQAYVMGAVSVSPLDTTQTMVIQGLDENWKVQEELIQLNGTTPVTTQFAYLRINRMLILGGGSLNGAVKLTQTGTTTPIYGYIRDGGFDINQTQQGFFSIPAGHIFLADSVDLTTYDAKKTNLYILVREWQRAEDAGLTDPPFRVQLNWNLFNMAYQPITTVPVGVDGKSDLELRGYTENSTDKATSVLQGVLVQQFSIPIDLGNYSVSNGGPGSITVSWDAQTPAETGDLLYFKVDYYETNNPSSRKEIRIDDRFSTGTTINGLISGVEYTVEAVWVGFDDRKSTTRINTITP